MNTLQGMNKPTPQTETLDTFVTDIISRLDMLHKWLDAEERKAEQSFAYIDDLEWFKYEVRQASVHCLNLQNKIPFTGRQTSSEDAAEKSQWREHATLSTPAAPVGTPRIVSAPARLGIPVQNHDAFYASPSEKRSTFMPPPVVNNFVDAVKSCRGAASGSARDAASTSARLKGNRPMPAEMAVRSLSLGDIVEATRRRRLRPTSAEEASEQI